MINQDILKKIAPLLLQGEFALEKENLRVDEHGHLALTPHPKIFGSKETNQYITTDFSESQIEIITPIFSSIEDLDNFVRTLHDVVSNEIGKEILWTQSLPPYLPDEDQIPKARYSSENKENEEYRHQLSKVYGKYRQLLCGIHFNVSLTKKTLEALQNELANDVSIDKIKEEVYLKITRGIMRYRWLLMWLYGKTPIAESQFKVRSLESNEDKYMRCGSSIALRTSPLGYRNREDYVMNFKSIEGYNSNINELVESGKLLHAKELYLPVRMKFTSESKIAPSYLELRFLDLDPLSPSGVDKDALYASYLLFMYSLLLEEKDDFGADAQALANEQQDYVSCFGRSCDSLFPENIMGGKKIVDVVSNVVQDMKKVLTDFGLLQKIEYANAIQQMEYLCSNPDQRKGIILYKQSEEKGFVDFHLNLAKEYKQQAEQIGYRFFGRENMEMSTQLLMRAALCKGVGIEILDQSENFIRLSKNGKSHLVVQATKTSLDNYASILAMENKVVTKKILEEAKISVPKGGEYFDKESAINSFRSYANLAIVIKPKSTNFGIGITILKENDSQENFNKAIDFAFMHDNAILIEHFVEGREYRIFVIDNEVVGILHRVPANVVGDGKSTVRQLVEQKNKDPRRGKGYRTPLEKINLGVEEELFLKLQSCNFDTVVEQGKQLFLRENSNISTGGDSIDFTDDVHPSYKQIAEHAAKAMDVRITGVDMMIKDIAVPANSENHSIIEVNFNPAIHIHCFPYKGKNRRLNFKILDVLGLSEVD